MNKGELEQLFLEHCGGKITRDNFEADRPVMTQEELQGFFKEVQDEELSIEEIMHLINSFTLDEAIAPSQKQVKISFL